MVLMQLYTAPFLQFLVPHPPPDERLTNTEQLSEKVGYSKEEEGAFRAKKADNSMKTLPGIL